MFLRSFKRGGDFGGEPSGSWVFPDVSLCPDGIYAAGRIAVIASSNVLSELIDEIPAYPILRGSVRVEGVVVSELEPRLAAMKPLSLDKRDGIRLSFADGWLLIRASGTEPKVRVTAEAKSQAQAEELYDSGIRIVKECSKEGRERVFEGGYLSGRRGEPDASPDLYQTQGDDPHRQ